MKFDSKADKAGKLDFEYRKEGGVLVINISGSMDSVTAPEFVKVIDERAGGADSAFAVNLNGLNHLSSAGLRSIAIIIKKLGSIKKKIVFISSNEDVNRIFKLAGFHNSLVQIFDSEAAALQVCA